MRSLGTTAPISVFAAAPGDVDTAGVLATLMPSDQATACHDLGGAVGLRIGRWERDGWLIDANGDRPLLLWCPVGREALTLGAALTLGRLAALLSPRRLTTLWFAAGDEAPGRGPDARHRQRALDLVTAAAPGAEISLHCLGWLGESRPELEELARRFS